ncbi:MAG: hypothetical protein AB1507_08975 [Bacillota bacterium]|nr:hypothetical protein [Thermoanaerobacteraceae bacterium]
MLGKKRGFLLPLIITLAVALAVWGGQRLTAVGQDVYDTGTANGETQATATVDGATYGAETAEGGTPGAETVGEDVYPPSPPQGFRAIEGDTGHDATLKWEPNTEPDLAGYQLYRATHRGGPWELVQILAAGETSFEDTRLTQGERYYYYLVALDTSGNASEPAPTVSVRPRQAVRAQFEQRDARTPVHLFIQPDCSAVFLNVRGDRILVRARATDENGDPVPLAGTIRFAAAFGRFRDPAVTGTGTAEATFTADQIGSGEIAVEYYPPGAEEPALADTANVRALEWHLSSLSASGDETTTGANDITLSVSVTDHNGRPVSDWQAQVVFETLASPDPAEKAKGKPEKGKIAHRFGRWQGRAHANIVQNGRQSGVSAGRPDENGQIEARWVASTVPGTTRVRVVLYYDDLRGPESPPKRVAASNVCTVKVVPGPVRYVGFDPASVPVTGEKQTVTVRAFDAFGNPTDDWGDLKVCVQMPLSVPAAFSPDSGQTWYAPGVWVPVRPNDEFLVRLTGKDFPEDRCVLTTRAEGASLKPPPGVPQVNLPLRIEEKESQSENGKRGALAFIRNFLFG